MANPEHVDVVRQGRAAIEEWRESNTVEQLDLSEANLSRANLNGVNLNGARLREANLYGALLRTAHLKGAHLREAHLNVADLRGADLARADLRGAHLNGAHLDEAHLSEADLRGAHLNGADLRGADLRGADLNGAYLRGANLTAAHLYHANLSRAYLREANLRGADLHGANFSNTSVLNVDLSTTRYLELVNHSGPSSIGIDTLFLSQGKIPEAFLRGCGVPDSLITYLPSLISTGIEFYSAFISYSHIDEEFAKRLHGRMQQEHLRVWNAPDDMKGGALMHEQIDTAIRSHDKLLLVLSEASINSKWVQREIRRARKREQQEGRRILFPIRLVAMHALDDWDFIDSVNDPDLAEYIRQFYIPDFSNWKDHDAFEREYVKLLRDLQQSRENAKGS